MMNQERWQKIDAVLQAALDLTPHERAAFLYEACAGDGELRCEIESLLAHEDSAEFFIETSAMKVVARSLIEQDLSNQRIGHYHILKPIGAGGMGKVYLAEDEKLERRVAIKFLPETSTADSERVRRFEQEARAASALNHPNIITIHEVGHTGDDKHFIVTEFIEGRTLRELMCDTRLDVRQAIEIAAQIASALKSAHMAFIVHRDIKPENIMVRADGLVKMLDFGIAKLTTEGMRDEAMKQENNSFSASPRSPVSLSLTSAGMILGTAGYMSPEQASGLPVDARTDIYALGLVLYEMLTGTRAPRTTSVLPQLAEDLNDAPKGLARILSKALRPQREERYESTAAMLTDLRRVQEQLQTGKLRRRLKASALVALALFFVVVLAISLAQGEEWEEHMLHDGHTAGVRRTAFSADGKWLVSVGEDHQVLVWEFARRELKRRLTDHTAQVVAVAFAPDRPLFATASWDQSIIVRNVETLETVAVLREQRGLITGVAFSPDGKYLAAASGEPDARTVLWDARQWTKVRDLPLEGGDWGPLLFSPTNPKLLLADNKACNVETGQEMIDLLKPDSSFAGVTFSPDGTRVVAVNSNGRVIFTDLARRRILAEPIIHRDHGRAAAYSPDGKLAATGSEDIALWNATTQELITRWDHTSYVWGLAFSPDSHYLVSTHGDGSILLWDMIGRERVGNLNQHSHPVAAVAISPDGRHVVSGGEDCSVIIWDATTWHKEAVLLGHRSRVTGVAFAPDGQWVASLDQNGELIRWDIASRQPSWRRKTYGIKRLIISPDGRWVVNGNGVYHSGTGELASLMCEPRGCGYAEVSFSADGRRLAAIVNSQIHVWDIEKQRLVEQTRTPHDELSISFAPDGRQFVTGNIAGEITLWQAEPLQPIAVIGHHDARVKQVAFAPDNQHAVSVSDDHKVKLWDVRARKLEQEIGTHTAPVLAVAFSRDSRQIVIGEHDRSVRVYTRHNTLWGWPLD